MYGYYPNSPAEDTEAQEDLSNLPNIRKPANCGVMLVGIKFKLNLKCRQFNSRTFTLYIYLDFLLPTEILLQVVIPKNYM